MLLKNCMVNTDLGTIKTVLAHCDSCGKKHLVSDGISGGAMGWLEVRRLDREVPSIHFCSLACLLKGVGELVDLGIAELSTDNWGRIFKHFSTAGEREGNGV